MSRRFGLAIACAAVAVLAGCNKAPSFGNEPQGPVTTDNLAGMNVAKLPPAQKAATADALPAPGRYPRFIGLWAADQKSCRTKAWRFTIDDLRTPAGSTCKFEKVTEVPGGYDIKAVCTAEGPATPDVLHIRFAESAKAMLFDSKTIASTGLVFCGRHV